MDDARRADGREGPCGVAGALRAVRQRTGEAISVYAARVPAGEAAGGQLADERLDATVNRPGRSRRTTVGRWGRSLWLNTCASNSNLALSSRSSAPQSSQRTQSTIT